MYVSAKQNVIKSPSRAKLTAKYIVRKKAEEGLAGGEPNDDDEDEETMESEGDGYDGGFDEQLENMKTWFTAMTVDKRMDVYRTLLDLPKDSFEEGLKEATEVVKLATPKSSVDFVKLLPTDIALKIFSFLDHRSLLMVASVSKTWAALSDNDALWKRLCWQHINKKCKQCGLGMPMAAIVRNQVDHAKTLWKVIFYERLQLEINWRGGKCHKTTLQTGVSVTCVVSDDRMIVSGHEDGQARIFCTRRLELFRTVQMHSAPITCLGSDEKRIISGSMDGTLKIWCAHSFNLVRTIPSQSRGVTSLAMSQNWLAAGGLDGDITVWSFTTGDAFVLKGHTGRVTGLGLMGFGLVSASEDSTVRTWSLQNKVSVTCIEEHKDGITGMTQIKNLFATSSRDKTIKVWQPVETGELSLVHTAFGHESPIGSAKIDNLRVVSGGNDHSIKIFDTSDGKMLYSLGGHDAPVDCISSRDSYIISGDRNGSLIHWNFAADVIEATHSSCVACSNG